MTLWSHDLARSRGKLKILHIGYKNTCDNQTWQDDLPWVGPTHKVTCPFSHVVFWDHVTKKTRFISATTVSLATKLGRMVAYLWGAPTFKVKRQRRVGRSARKRKRDHLLLISFHICFFLNLFLSWYHATKLL